MALENGSARSLSLTPPATPRQFAAERVRAGAKQRRAARRLAVALKGGEDDNAVPRGVDIAELSRAWASLRDLREDLRPEDEERLHRQLAAYMSGESWPGVWHATVNAILEARRAAEVPVVARSRKWRQSWPDLNGW
jgi:hypothetical protein